MSSRFLRGPIHNLEMRKLESFAYDCTVGKGELFFELPTPRAIDELATLLKRKLDEDDVKLFTAVWKRCIQEARQP